MKAGMEYLAASLFLLLRLLTLISALARNLDPPRYDTAYACEGKVLKIECREGELIQLIRANYGRFSITICNDHGNTEWSVNCMSPKSFRVLHSKCTQQQNCSIPANTNLFGDPCAGTLKYLEAHYRCIPAATTTTTTRPSPPWLMASQPNVWSTAKLPTLRPPSHPPYSRASVAPPLPDLSSEKTSSPSLSTTSTTTAATTIRTSVAVAPTKAAVSRESQSTKSPPPALESVDDVNSSLDVNVTPGVPVVSTSLSSSTPSSSSSSWKPTIKMDNVPGYFPDYSENTPVPTASRVPEGDASTYCPPVFSRNLEWNWTHIGEVNVQPCPGGAAGLARWSCSPSGKWGNATPDLSQCRSVWLTSLDARIEENDSVINVANDLSQVTSSKTLYGGDMMTTTAIIKKITERVSRNIQTFPDSQQREAIVTELLQSVVKTASNLLDSSQDSSWKDLSYREQMKVATSLLVGLEENAFLLADTVIREKTVVQAVKNILLSVRVMDVANVQETERFPGVQALEQRPNCTDWLEVPRSAMLDNSEGGFVRLIFVAFERLDDLLQPRNILSAVDTESNSVDAEKNASKIVNTKVISASLGKGRHIQFTDFVRLGMKHLRTENVSNPTCVFWDYTTSAWSEEGCEIESTNKSYTICRCNHLTNFAVLMDVDASHLPQANHSALQIITYIGCIISIVCLFLAVITFQLFRSLKSDRTTIHKNLCMCLLLAEILFLLGIGQTDKPILCGVVAGLLHFVFLCAFAWMFLEGFQLYIMLIEVFEVEKSRIRWYYMFAYGAPLIIVCISCVVDPLSYGTDRYCWLRADNFFIFSFVGPVIAVILANLVFLSMAIYMMCRHSSASVSLKSKEHSRLASARTWLRGAIVLVFLLGLTWTFGLLYLNEESVVMAYVFSVLNSLQGLFIFIFHCLHNEKVRKEYRKWNSWLPKCVKCKKYQNSSATMGKERRSSVYGTSHGAPSGNNSHTHPSIMGDAMMSLPNGNSSVGTDILDASHRYHHSHHSPAHHQDDEVDLADEGVKRTKGGDRLRVMVRGNISFFTSGKHRKSPNNDLGHQDHCGEDLRSNYGQQQQHGMTLSSLPTSSFNIHEHENNYADRISTLRSLHGDVDLRRQHYRHGPDRVLVCELERHPHGSRAATLQLPRRRRDHYGDEVLRKGDVDDPVYEEIRQAASDASDEELRRCLASRQSLRSCGDYSPLIPSSHGTTDPARLHGSHMHVVSDPHGFLYSPRSHMMPIDR